MKSIKYYNKIKQILMQQVNKLIQDYAELMLLKTISILKKISFMLEMVIL